MASFEIEAGVPQADVARPGPRTAYRRALDALALAQVGASFFIPTGTHARAASAGQIAVNLYGGGWFSCRKVEGGQRIWKIAEPKLRPQGAATPRIVRSA